ncbi:conserved hypothetical protein [Arcobacter nitrofigilis DSM 7299]|uniref:FlgN family protein n=1 Tax=Arcobacter nitrofigilis (strain ATCC 33309 / DSM 7299 / CCUG 15893 / LMG 7604 / NCTC 12251 / CI) TaxID=572480 RepID=D5UZ85_ARCNC|nr:hypothetical protein [Arcobacter nitrofigilis]ADG94137.1 conserved hypothetical protein [Arcobacter nitrofigilis DSM 7299]
MIKNITDEMSSLVIKMKDLINSDIEDIKAARHEKLLDRNDDKQKYMDRIIELRKNLNDELVNKMQEGVDINTYRDDVDTLEQQLQELHILNAKLASIVLPIQQMYKDIVEELTSQSGGNIVEIKV